jgi:hypothetical protein
MNETVVRDIPSLEHDATKSPDESIDKSFTSAVCESVKKEKKHKIEDQRRNVR